MDVEISHLRYFVAVADKLNFTRAAESLHMAVSPLSQRIRDLERELGAPLFVRDRRTVELTRYGEQLLPEARDVVRRFDSFTRTARQTKTEHGRHIVRIGIAPDVSTTLRTRVLDIIEDVDPALEVQLRPGSTEPLIAALDAGELDIALVHGPIASPDLHTVTLEIHSIAVIVARGLGFDDKTEIGLRELAALPYASIAFDAAPFLYRRVDEILTHCGVHKRLTLEGHDFAGLAHLVSSGRAFTLAALNGGMTTKAFAGDPVISLPVTRPKLTMTTVAAVLENRTEPRVETETITSILESLRASHTVP
ncbi:LysR family transcriptional regulator [Rhodococcus sp. T7]|uniref:LysR family transcriptional regulator n=1 Tax=Rhodococcus sp. T7 TaxID=627444 RepID=UPI00135A6F0D|nr:LysR family transcriptional regulator [Rhodococcus sp. T7]